MSMLNKKQIARVKIALPKENDRLPFVFQALGDPCRFNIFALLMQRRNLCVTDIANIFGITISAASQQLRALERVSLVQKIRMGQMVCYEINRTYPIAKQLAALLSSKNTAAESKKRSN